MKQWLTMLALLMLAVFAQAQTARVQIIHNSPTPGTAGGPVVDIYVNGDLLPQLTAVPFRAATSFLDVPSGVDLTVDVKVSPSTPADPAVASFPIGSLADGGAYVVTAAGIVGDPAKPFNLFVNGAAQESAAIAGKVDLAVFHGSPDAPAVDVDARAVGNLIQSLAFGAYTGYLSVDPATYYLDVRAAGDPGIVSTFKADLSGLAGGAATVFASGLLGDSPAFGLFAALPDGTVVELPASPVARVQLIHNSPSPTVDIYVNGDLFLPAFEFRTATPFVFVPAETPLDIAVAPAGVDPSVINVYTGGPLTLENGGSYVVVANGIAGNPFFPFSLAIQQDARESSASQVSVDFNVFHGSPGAPGVDVSVFGQITATIATDVTYGEFTGYVSAPAAPYFLTVSVPSLGLDIPFYADLQELGGGAATVFASGLVGGNPGFGLFAALANGDVIEIPQITEFADINIIHNSPSQGAEVVDVYLNGGLAVDDFAFRTATGFISVPAGLPLTISVAPGNSSSVAEAIAAFPIPTGLEGGENYIVTAGGLVGDPDFPFGLQIYAGARKEAVSPSSFDALVLHSSPGAPAVDVGARTIGNLVTDLEYGEYAGYLEIPAENYYLDIRATGSPDIVATFNANLIGLEGSAATIFASGLLGGSPAFGLFAAFPDGTVVELPASPVARVQLIHNSPSPTVDIYVNGDLFLPGFEFRTATPFVFVPAETPLDIAVTPAGGDPSVINVYTGGPLTLENGGSYVVVANGIAGDATFPFTLAFQDEARESSASMDNVDFNILHGSPGAPGVDVSVFGVVTGTLATDVTYGEFTGYVSAPAAPYFLTVSVPSLGLDIPFYADLQGLGGGAATVFASGLVGGNPGFGLFAALANGEVVQIPQITEFAEVNIIHNSPSQGAEEVDVYLNGGLAVDDFAFRTATGFITIPAGFPLTISVAPGSSSSVAEAIAAFPLPTGLEGGENYIVTAGGLVGDPDFPFGLQIYAGARQQAAGAGNVDVLALHSSPGAPAVDIDARTVGNLIADLAYGEYAGYLELPANDYFLDIRVAGSPDIVATFLAPLSLFEDEALTVFASGLLAGTPGFGLFAADAEGNVFELQAVEISRTQIIHNSPDPSVDVYLNGAIAIPGLAFREATPYLFTPANEEVQVTIVPQGGNPATDAVFDAPVVFGENGQTLVVMATGVAGDPETPFGLAVYAGGRESAASGVDLLLYHGSPDAPEVDVVVSDGGPVLFDNIAYGDFSADYLNVPADAYELDITPADDNSTVVATYAADLTGLDGGAAVVFASGFFSGAEPEFGVWVALPDGTTFPLELILSANEITSLNGWSVSPNPAPQGAMPMLQVDMASTQWAAIRLLDANGRIVGNVFQGQLSAGKSSFSFETGALAPGMYFVQLQTQNGSAVEKLVITR